MTPEDARDRLRYLTLATRDAAYDWDVSTGSLWCSETVQEFYSPHEAIRADRGWWEERVHPDDLGRVRESLAAAFGQRRRIWSEQYRFQRSDGSHSTVIDRGYVVYDPAGRAVRMVGAMADVTERERAESLLRTSEARYRALVESVRDDTLTLGPWDGNGASEEILRWWGRLTGQTREDQARPGAWLEAVHPEDRDRVCQSWTESSTTGMPYQIEYRVRSASGAYRHILVRGVPVRQADGRPGEFAGMLMDVTELKRLEEQLQQAQKMEAVGRLAGGVAHDFNNLLTVIKGYSELILDRLAPDDKLARLVAEVKKAGDRGMAITGQLLALGRKAVVEPVLLDLNAVVAEAETMLRRLIEENIELTSVLSTDLWRVKADRTQIEQILLNLSVNARDAMPRGGTLTIETRNVDLTAVPQETGGAVRPGEYVRLAVTDTGGGMDEATKARVFEPFFTTKGVGKGTGMGLAVVYGIVQQFGGQIQVESQPGHGSTFSILLPRCRQEEVAAPVPPETPSVSRGHETVLLVEDDDAVRTLAGEILAQQGYTVLEAKNGPEALRLCQGHSGALDLLATDVVMPRMSGLRLADRLRAVRPHVKVLFISGYPDEALGEHGVQASDIVLLQKPFAPATLTRKVREVLDRPLSPLRSAEGPPVQVG
jgi:PAS domain S-box-containing protein